MLGMFPFMMLMVFFHRKDDWQERIGCRTSMAGIYGVREEIADFVIVY